jgi:isoleucyl-tRNA synthetase
VDPKQELPAMELEVLERWRERDVFRKSLQLRAGAPRWVFYEGPPTANGPPGSHHVLSRVFKDIYPRFQTMRGRQVERKGGWDCHGLPVEIAVEQQLGITSKHEIEDPEVIGIERFNAACRESVFAYLKEWDRLTERIGFWIDLDHAYRTLDESYIESVWWALAEIDRRGLLYEGHKVVPYCYRCGTALSSHEVALGYEDVVDRSVYVRLPVFFPTREQAGGLVQQPGGPTWMSAQAPDPSSPLREGDELLVWTTTPWTLPGNVAVAVGPEIEYGRARTKDGTFVLAAALVEGVLGEEAEILERFPGNALVGQSYAGPIFNTGQEGGFPIVAGEFVSTEDGTGIVHIAPAFGEDDFRVAAANGIGGFDPSLPGTLVNPVRPDGTFDGRVRSYDGREYEGRLVKDTEVTEDLIADLRARGLLFREERYEHSYPHCWRCGTPLIYYAKKSWYIRTTAVRERMLAANEQVSWHPGHVKHGRFGDWLSNNVDWALSRERYWGTPLPVWRCGRGHTHTIGSFGELAELSGEEVMADHHRPYVDEATFPCPHVGGEQAADSDGTAAGAADSGAADSGGACGEPMRRVAEVIDVWFDSGAMPFAQHHHPFEHEEAFREGFPADFICEAQDQTRGWFYSLLAISTLLGREGPYRNVVCLGLILDEEGQKMSKSRGNTVEPWQVLDTYGADALRWYFFTSKQPWDGYRFSEESIADGVRLFLKQLWSTYYFYVLYAQAGEEALRSAAGTAGTEIKDGKEVPKTGAPRVRARAGGGSPIESHSLTSGESADNAPTSASPASGEAEDLDRWALSRTATTADVVMERLEAYDATGAGRAIGELVDELSNWYVRRSRRRFWDGEKEAFETLRTCLVAVAKLLAPLCPFMADEIYDNLDGELGSVHLCDFPTGDELGGRDEELEGAMGLARETVGLGLGARGKAKLKVRQPLREAVVVADGREREGIERMAEIVREELNVKRVRFVAAAEELGRYEVKANYRALGPLFGRDMPGAAEAIAALDPAKVAAAMRGTEASDPSPVDGASPGDEDLGIGISVGGREHVLRRDDVILTMKAPEGYSVEREGAHGVALDLSLDEELVREGRAREMVHAIQNARKEAGLQVEDRIELWLAGDGSLVEAAEEHRDYLAGETLALALTVGENGLEWSAGEGCYREATEVDGLELTIALRRTAS